MYTFQQCAANRHISDNIHKDRPGRHLLFSVSDNKLCCFMVGIILDENWLEEIQERTECRILRSIPKTYNFGLHKDERLRKFPMFLRGVRDSLEGNK